MYNMPKEWSGRSGRWTYHHDDSFDAVCKSFIATFLPIVGGLRRFTEHHGRAMGEEVDWCEGHIWHCQIVLGGPVDGTKKVLLGS